MKTGSHSTHLSGSFIHEVSARTRNKVLAFFTLILAALLLLVFSGSAYPAGLITGDGPWQWVHPALQGATINDIEFVDANTGWGAGIGGIILKTEDGGGTWTPQTSGTEYNLWGIDFINANEGWAVGDYGIIIHTSDGGATWNTQSVPNPSQYPSLLDVSFADSNSGVISGGGYAYFTSNGGATWNQSSGVGSYDYMSSVQMLNATTAVAVGSTGKVFKSIDGGASWSLRTSNTAANLNDVYFQDGSNGFAVGTTSTTASRIIRTTDGGETWQGSSGGLINSALWGVRVSGGDTLMAVGRNGAMLRYQSSGLFSADAIDDIAAGLDSGSMATGTISDLLAIDFPDASTGYASGAAGIILKGDSSSTPWNILAGGDAISLLGSSFINSDVGWFVGQYGTVMKTTDGGESWTGDSSGIPSDVVLQDVQFLDQNTGYTVGCQGPSCPSAGTPVIYKYSSGSWSAMSGTGGAEPLYAIQMADANNGWAVGGSGTVLRTTDGATWVSDSTGIGTDIEVNDVDSGGVAGNAWAVGQRVGAGGVIMKYNGGAWTVTDEPDATFLTSIDMLDATTGFAVGLGSTSGLKTVDGGATWTPMAMSTSRLLANVSFLDANTGYAAGDLGRIVKTVDGGATWTIESSGTNVSLYALSVVPMLGSTTGHAAFTGGGNAAVLRALIHPELTFTHYLCNISGNQYLFSHKITSRIVIENTGNATANNVSLSNLYRDGLSGFPIQCNENPNLGNIAPGEKKNVDCELWIGQYIGGQYQSIVPGWMWYMATLQMGGADIGYYDDYSVYFDGGAHLCPAL